MANEQKHTPGPWKIKEYASGKGFLIRDKDRRAIAKINVSFSQDVEQKRANAHLLWAAPDLLEALEIIQTYHDAFPEALGSYERNRVDEAVKKARGA